ncbi:hypothetical protein [Desulfomarina sp.]
MSLPIDKTLAWLRIGSVPLLLIASSVLAIWLSSRADVPPGPPSSPIPQLNIDLSKITNPLTMEERTGRTAAIYRDPFIPLQEIRPARERVNLHSITLDLVVISPRKRLCWINGQMMKEGEKTQFFKLITIKKNGVWYATRTGKYFLATGESILIDNLGIFHTEENEKTAELKP